MEHLAEGGRESGVNCLSSISFRVNHPDFSRRRHCNRSNHRALADWCPLSTFDVVCCNNRGCASSESMLRSPEMSRLQRSRPGLWEKRQTLLLSSAGRDSVCTSISPPTPRKLSRCNAWAEPCTFPDHLITVTSASSTALACVVQATAPPRSSSSSACSSRPSTRPNSSIGAQVSLPSSAPQPSPCPVPIPPHRAAHRIPVCPSRRWSCRGCRALP